MLGYTKSELVNKNISSIMPQVFGKVHDEILKSYLESSELFMSGAERMLWVKTKANYLYYSEIHIKPVYHPLKVNPIKII